MTASAYPERWRLANGLSVFYREDKNFPLAYATLLFRSGSRAEPSAQAGLCSMTVDLLMQGTRRRNARRLASDMESVGGSIGTQVHEDYSEMGFVVPAPELDRALGVMHEVLSQPSFPADEIAKEKSHVLAALASRRDAIFNVAYDPLSRALYGDHSYGRPLEGTKKTVSRFKRADFQRWHQAYIVPEEGILSLVAPFPKKDVLKKMERTMGTWLLEPVRLPPQPAPVRVNRLEKSQTLEIKTSFEQAYYMVGWQAPESSHEDHILLKVLNTILGGGMSSRLFSTLREKLGLAYEVSSFYPSRLDRSQWTIYLGLPKEKLGIAAKKLEELLHELADRGPTPQEVRQAKMMIRGAFIMDRQSRRRQALYTALWEFLGRGLDYGNEFLAAVDAVTPTQLQKLLQNMLKRPRITVKVIPK